MSEANKSQKRFFHREPVKHSENRNKSKWEGSPESERARERKKSR